MRGNYQVVGCGDLKHCFFEDFAFNFTILSHPPFGLEINCSEARAFKVGTKGLMTFTEKDMVTLDASGKVGVGKELVPVGSTVIAANGNEFGLWYKVEGLLCGGQGNGVGKLFK